MAEIKIKALIDRITPYWDSKDLTYKINIPCVIEDDNSLFYSICLNNTERQYTGFKDRYGKEIYDGDILSDFVEADEGLIKSYKQVFWNKKRGAWHLDNSFEQNKTDSEDLWFELNDIDYEISGNIYQNSNLLKNETKTIPN